jgi:CRP-like cAMP-binding protein
MFFIGKGDCEVRIRDERGREHEQVRLLVEGDHFGEISLIYKCKRSASVISRNYNTLAKITSNRYRELVAEYPEYEIELKKYVRETYNDPKIQFVIKMIERVEYL